MNKLRFDQLKCGQLFVLVVNTERISVAPVFLKVCLRTNELKVGTQKNYLAVRLGDGVVLSIDPNEEVVELWGIGDSFR